MDHDIKNAIDNAVTSIIEQVLWHLSTEEMDRDRVLDRIADCDDNEAAAIGLSLDQKLEVIEQGAEECGLGDLSFNLEDLRSSLESYAVMAVHWLAESEACRLFEDLFDFMEENGLEIEQMRSRNPFGWMPHRSEREEGPSCTVYEYRDVEEPGRHIDVWELRLSTGDRVWWIDELDRELVEPTRARRRG